jgi:hypothetical protein
MTALSELYAQVRVSGAISADDVLKVRRALYGSGRVLSGQDIETLLRIEDATEACDPAWEELLVEASIDHLVRETEPIDVIDEGKAGWLLDRIAADGRVKTARQLELLIRVLEASRKVPEPLVALALRQVRAAVVDGDGPLAGMKDADPGRITREETEQLRRILYAFGGGHRGVAITRAEAEVIFDINDAAKAGNNDPEWTDLFVKSIANCVMAASGYQSPPREVALAVEDREGGPAADRDRGFFADYAVQGLRGILRTYAPPKMGQWSQSARPDADAGRVAEIEKSDAVWLAERISRDGTIDDNEKALLRFIRDEAGSVHPALRELIVRAA